MRGAKRLASSSDVDPPTSDSAFQSRRVLASSPFDAQRAEQSQQKLPPCLDAKRAESARQHVRALNNQFVSWVQTQLRNHPDELWEDGIRDYLSHASNIIEKFSDVVTWLKANAAKGENSFPSESSKAQNKSASEFQNNEVISNKEKVAFAPEKATTGSTSPWSSSLSSKSQPGVVTDNKTRSSGSNQSGAFSKSEASFKLPAVFSNSHSGAISGSQPSASGSQSSTLFSNSQPSASFSGSQPSASFSGSQPSASFSGSQPSTLFSGSKPLSLFLGSQPSASLSSGQPSSSFSSGQPSSSFSSGQPLSSFSSGQPLSSFSSGQPLSSFSSGQPLSSFSSGQPLSSFSSGQPLSSFSSCQPLSSFSSGQPLSSFSSGQPLSSFSSGQPLSSFSGGQPLSSFSSGQPSSSFSSSQPSASLSSTQPSALFSSTQPSALFSGSQPPTLLTSSKPVVSFGTQGSNLTIQNASEDVGGDDEPPQPSSPSVKKTEEKGVVIVHEVKCKLYIKSSDPDDKGAWKDKGTGQLSIKCKEGVDKGTKESKPTILIRNDVGKLLLNALLYPGIKTNKQKNSIVAIFHSSDDTEKDNVVARTFLIKTKSEEDRNKLAAAIQEYAPAS